MKVAVIGSGFSGIAAAAYASKEGHEVHVFEKNEQFGGRARQFQTANGYRFDMGPSWYWMPDIMAAFFNDFGESATDYYRLTALNPQFEMVFDDGELAVPADFSEMVALFESVEAGAGEKLKHFMAEARYKYEIGMKDFVSKPCHSWLEFASPKLLKNAFKLNLLTNFHRYVRRYFKHPKLIALMEFPVIFLGASPKDIPALYSLMHYGGYGLGTWYPDGGFIKVIEAMATVATHQGVTFHRNAAVQQIIHQKNEVVSLRINGAEIMVDAVISSADYHHTETALLAEDCRNYTEAYWKKKTFAPSCLIYYLGINKQIPGLKHHTLFFENDLSVHTSEIYTHKQWPTKPLFYVCCPSKTDKQVAPPGCENLFLLMPIATGIEDTEEIREKYFQQMIRRLEKRTGTDGIIGAITYKRSYCMNDFVEDYNAYEGNAYGLANTLSQTAVLKPSVRNRKLKNLFYTGQLTVPGPGVPPAIISGKIAAQELKTLNH